MLIRETEAGEATITTSRGAFGAIYVTVRRGAQVVSREQCASHYEAGPLHDAAVRRYTK